MLKILKKRALAFAVAVTLFFIPYLQPTAFATEPNAQTPDSWAISELVDAQALNLLPPDYATTLKSAVSDGQASFILCQVRKELSLLEIKQNSGERKVETDYELTRGNLVVLLYNELLAYELPGEIFDKTLTPMQYMVEKGIIKGYGNGNLGEGNPCTLQEALMIAQRFISNIYEDLGESSNGFLWKVTKGSNTLYLLGTVHVDRGSVYPFSSNLKQAILSSGETIFEVDFLNQEGLAYFMQKQLYSDDTTLKDHISADLYEKVLKTMVEMGYTEEQVASIKPWALANMFSSLSLLEDDTTAPMVMDSYIYSKALAEGKRISEVEGYAYQADLFDSLSVGYQENYLTTCYYEYLLSKSGAEGVETIKTVDEWLTCWKNRNVAGFEAVYGKDALSASDDELLVLLFGDRDENMTTKAVGFLESEGINTYMLVVGAGHMVGEKGIVNSLKTLGYQVELVPVD